MTSYQHLNHIIDNSNGFTDSPHDGRYRSIRITFDERRRGGYGVRLWGRAIEDRDSNLSEGHLRADRETIGKWLRDLHDAWGKSVLTWQDRTDRRPGVRRPFVDLMDLRGGVKEGDVQGMWRAIASAGNRLFRQLFYEGDAHLGQIGDRLAAALRDDRSVSSNLPHVITVSSNDIVAPWGMLYISTPREGNLTRDFTVERARFLGYRHIVEHSFNLHHHANPHIRSQHRVIAHSYVDTGLDQPRPYHPAAEPVLAAVLDFLDEDTVHTRRTTKDDLAEDLGGVALDSELIYFCCHCRNPAGNNPTLHLSDQASISTGDVQAWLVEERLRRSPFVFLNACDAGNPSAHSASHFSHVLMKKGAGCLLGPYVGAPKQFASVFAKAVLQRMLRERCNLGDAVSDLIIKYADEYDNPLGLTYMIYHGVDSHFCSHPAGGDAGAAYC